MVKIINKLCVVASSHLSVNINDIARHVIQTLRNIAVYTIHFPSSHTHTLLVNILKESRKDTSCNFFS